MTDPSLSIDRPIEWTVVVPVKGTSGAKSRLGGSPALALAIALDSVEAALGAARVIVVTTEEVAPGFAQLGAHTVIDADEGLIAACLLGIAAADQRDPAGAIAVMLGDVPALDPAELTDALRLAAAHPLGFVPDADNDGTVLITALRASDHAPAFGGHSRSAHLAAGYVELELPLTSGLRRDVDTADQLAAIPRERLGLRTARLAG